MAMTLNLAECGGGYDGGTPPANDGFTLGASVSGLTSRASLVLQNNCDANLPVNANGASTFGAARRGGQPLRGDCERLAEWPDPRRGHSPHLPLLPPGFASDLLSAEHAMPNQPSLPMEMRMPRPPRHSVQCPAGSGCTTRRSFLGIVQQTQMSMDIGLEPRINSLEVPAQPAG